MNDQHDPREEWTFGDREQTRPLPPFEQPQERDESSGPRRSGRLTAAVLVGALVLGGVAGIGGAAWYDAWQGTPSASSSGESNSDTGGVISANTATLEGGSVEGVAQKVLPSVVRINVSGNSGNGSGSGIVLTSDGRILTNNHVVSMGEGAEITVTFNDGKTVRAKVLGTDPLTDVAVIQAEGVSDLTTATIGKSGALKVGQSVVAIGSPYGLDATVTTGIVSALHRPVSVESQQQEEEPSNPFGFPGPQQQATPNLSTTYPAIQTDAAINPGNSGGPLVDMAGRVVGINSSIRTASSGASGSIGLGFSIPIDEVLPIINQIVDGEKPTHARLGVSVSDIGSNTLQAGARIAELDPKGAAAEAGLKTGDIITKVGDRTISSSEGLVATVRGHRPGDRVEITFVRGGKENTATVTLASDEETRDS